MIGSCFPINPTSLPHSSTQTRVNVRASCWFFWGIIKKSKIPHQCIKSYHKLHSFRSCDLVMQLIDWVFHWFLSYTFIILYHDVSDNSGDHTVFISLNGFLKITGKDFTHNHMFNKNCKQCHIILYLNCNVYYTKS